LVAPPQCLANLVLFVFSAYGAHLHLHSFPTRRSSDLVQRRRGRDRRRGRFPPPHESGRRRGVAGASAHHPVDRLEELVLLNRLEDRKSTRLNSSHVEISYAVFCLKKKKNAQMNCPSTG